MKRRGRGNTKNAFAVRLMACLLTLLAACALAGCDALQPAGKSAATVSAQGFNLANVPGYAGEPSVPANGNAPAFTDADRQRGAFEDYSPLDKMGRCGVAFALVGEETMPDGTRGSIGSVKPSGWHLDKYDWIDGRYLYNRCHLIGWQLAGENDNERNLITGTRYLNTQGMLPYENQVADYVRSTGNHVLYRVTPVFEGDNLVASGVLMEAESLEDAGVGLRFCVWCYNVEPGVSIDYATGDNKPDGSKESAEGAGSYGVPERALGATAGGEAVAGGEAAAAPSDSGQASSASSSAGVTGGSGASTAASPRSSGVPDSLRADETQASFILNTNSHKFHLPDCKAVADMSERNKFPFAGTREQAIEYGYEPCGICKP